MIVGFECLANRKRVPRSHPQFFYMCIREKASYFLKFLHNI